MYLEKHHSEISSVDFRSKINGWFFFHISYKLCINKFIHISSREDPYFVGFNDSLYLRESCYDCRFKKDNHYSDITLGDFWEVKKIEWYERVKQNLIYMPLNYELVCVNHNMIVNSAGHRDLRDKFYEKYNGCNLQKVVANLRIKPSIKKRIKKRIIKIFKKVF